MLKEEQSCLILLSKDTNIFKKEYVPIFLKNLMGLRFLICFLTIDVYHALLIHRLKFNEKNFNKRHVMSRLSINLIVICIQVHIYIRVALSGRNNGVMCAKLFLSDPYDHMANVKPINRECKTQIIISKSLMKEPLAILFTKS